MLFHNFHKAMSKAGMTKLSTKKMKENSTVFPDQYNRVAKNGCIAVLVDNRTNLPLAILTPYGALSLNAVQTLKSQVTYENEFADLTEKFGLVKSDSLNNLGHVHGMGTPLFSVFAVTKIPAKERKSIFSRQNKENKTTKFTLPQPTSFEIPSEARDSLRYPHKKHSDGLSYEQI